MAKKNNQMAMIMNIVIIVLAILTVCTLFMPVIKVVGESALGNSEASFVKGTDVISATFAGELPESSGAASIYLLRTGDEHSFVTTVFCWAYLLTVLVSVATLVFAVLGMLGMKFKLVNTVLGAALVVLAIVAFIFTLVVANKFDTDLVIGKVNGSGAIGAFIMFAGLVAGGLQAYMARSK